MLLFLPRIPVLLFFCTLSLFFFSSCSAPDTEQAENHQPETKKKQLIAVVNNEKITLSDLDNALRFINNTRFISHKESTELTVPLRGKQKVLDELINEALQRQEAEKMNVRITERELQEQIKKAIEVPVDIFKKDLASAGLSYFDWKQKLRYNLLNQKLFQQVILNNIIVTDEEIRKYYEEHKEDYFEPAGVEVSQIVMKSEAEANIIYQQLVGNPLKWKSILKEFGDIEGGKSGNMGVITKGMLPEEMDSVIFSLKPGHISAVTKTPYGYHIFKVLRRVKAKTAELDKVRSDIFQLLSQKKAEKRYHEWLETIRHDAKIITYPQNL